MIGYHVLTFSPARFQPCPSNKVEVQIYFLLYAITCWFSSAIQSANRQVNFKFIFSFLYSQQILGVHLVKYDELECLVHGIHFIHAQSANECYYWNNLNCLEKSEKVSYDFKNNRYPYIVVNIGSGVSILLVESAEKFSRISGTR